MISLQTYILDRYPPVTEQTASDGFLFGSCMWFISTETEEIGILGLLIITSIPNNTEMKVDQGSALKLVKTQSQE